MLGCFLPSCSLLNPIRYVRMLTMSQDDVDVDLDTSWASLLKRRSSALRHSMEAGAGVPAGDDGDALLSISCPREGKEIYAWAFATDGPLPFQLLACAGERFRAAVDERIRIASDLRSETGT